LAALPPAQERAPEPVSAPGSASALAAWPALEWDAPGDEAMQERALVQ
jgi:hypothetical protein